MRRAPPPSPMIRTQHDGLMILLALFALYVLLRVW